MSRLLVSMADAKLEAELASVAAASVTSGSSIQGSVGVLCGPSELLAASLSGRPQLLDEVLKRAAGGGAAAGSGGGGGLSPAVGLASVHASSRSLLGAPAALQVGGVGCCTWDSHHLGCTREHRMRVLGAEAGLQAPGHDCPMLCRLSLSIFLTYALPHPPAC